MTPDTTDRLPVPDYDLANSLAQAAIYNALTYDENVTRPEDDLEAHAVDLFTRLARSTLHHHIPGLGFPYGHGATAVAHRFDDDDDDPSIRYVSVYIPVYGPQPFTPSTFHVVLTARLCALEGHLCGEITPEERNVWWLESSRFSADVYDSREDALADVLGLEWRGEPLASPTGRLFIRGHRSNSTATRLEESRLGYILGTLIQSAWRYWSHPGQPYRFVDDEGELFPDTRDTQAEVVPGE